MGVLRYSRGDNRNGFSLTGMGYWADWDSTDQVPERAIESGLIPRFGFLDASDGGTANRQSLAAEYQRSSGPSSLRATGFLLHNSLNLFSNFTYFLDDPDNGDQFEQAERRVAGGGRSPIGGWAPCSTGTPRAPPAFSCGVTGSDPVPVTDRCAPATLDYARDEVGQTMAAVYAQSEIDSRIVRTTFGLRADRYQFSVASDNPLNSGAGSDSLVSPSLALSLALGPALGLCEWGTGFTATCARRGHHRGRRARVGRAVTPLVRAKGAEIAFARSASVVSSPRCPCGIWDRLRAAVRG